MPEKTTNTTTSEETLFKVETPKHTYLCLSVYEPENGLVKLAGAMVIETPASTPSAELAKAYMFKSLQGQLRDVNVSASMVIASEEMIDVAPILKMLQSFQGTAEKAVHARAVFDELLRQVPTATPVK